MLRRKRLLALVGVALAAACSDEPAKDRDGRGPGAVSEIDEIVNAYCGSARSCCLAAGFPPGPIADCEAVFSGLDAFDAVRRGTVTFREPARTECVQALNALGRSCVDTGGSCSGIFDGTLGEGAACDDAIECRLGTNGAACVRIRTGGVDPALGVCRALTRGTLGTPCFQTTDSATYAVGYTTDDPNPALGFCSRLDGYYCDFGSGVCQAVIGEGAACLGYDSCADGLYCDDVCMRRLPAGSPCESFDQCNEGLGCTAGVCAVRRISDGDLCEGDFD